MQGKGDAESGAAVYLAVHLDVAIVLFDDIVDDGQAQARSLTDRLGGEKRVKYLFQVLVADAATVVLKAYCDLFGAFFPADRYPAFAVYGIDGVDEKIDEKLLQTGGKTVKTLLKFSFFF